MVRLSSMKNGNEGMSNLSEIENLNKQIYQLKKNIELVKEDAQVEIMRRDIRIKQLEDIDKKHQDLNGKLRLELTRLKGL
jgi:small-conductance mechanosensitive channel